MTKNSRDSRQIEPKPKVCLTSYVVAQTEPNVTPKYRESALFKVVLAILRYHTRSGLRSAI